MIDAQLYGHALFYLTGIPAEGLASYAKDMWQNVAESSPTVAAVVPKDVPMGSNSAVVVADAGYAKALELAKAKMVRTMKILRGRNR